MAATPGYIDSDMILFIKNVKDRNGVALTDGTVTYTIKSRHLIEGEYQEVDSGSLTHTASGRYEKIIDQSVMGLLVEGRRYYVTITFSNPAGLQTKKRFEVYGAYSS